MPRYASGKVAKAQCDRCGWVVKYLSLRNQVVAGLLQNLWVCPECLDEDQPQWQVRFLRVDDAMALRQPRPFQGVSTAQVPPDPPLSDLFVGPGNTPEFD